MSYITHYVIRAIGGAACSRKAILDTLEKIPAGAGNDFVRIDDQLSFPSPFWYGGVRDAELRELSKKYPDVIIEVAGDGSVEDSFDLWKQRWRGGSDETCRFDPASLGNFEGILTPEEEHKLFFERIDRCYKMLDAVHEMAWKHILGTVKRITGDASRELNFRRVNKDRDGGPCVCSRFAGECSVDVIEGVIPDEEALRTDKGDSVDCDDICIDDLKKVVRFFDDLEKDVASGAVQCFWNGYEEHYQLYIP